MGFLRSVPRTQAESFRYEKAHYNFQRVLVFSLILFFLHIIFLGVDYLNYKNGDWITTPNYRYLFYAHLALQFFLALFISIFAYHYWRKAYRYKQKEIISNVFVLFILLWGATVSLIDQGIHGEITVLILASVAISSAMLTSHLFSFLALLFANAFFIFGLHFVGITATMMQGHAVNAMTIGVVSWFLSRIIYNLHIREFENRRVIESKTMDLSEAGVWDYNFINNTVQYSRQWKTMLGYEDNEIPDDSNEWQSRVHLEDRERVLKARDLYVQGLAPNFSEEYRMRCKDGSYRWILDRSRHKYTDENGKIIRVIGTHTDITELKKIEENLHAAIREAEASATSKNTFLSNISNEFHSPLHTILNASEYLDSVFANTETQDVINRIRNAGNSLKDLVNDVMDYAKIEAGKFEIQNHLFDLSITLTSLEKKFRLTAAQRGIGFYSNGFLDPSSRKISSDENRIRQMMIILLRQAMFSISPTTIGLEYSFAVAENGKATFTFVLIASGSKPIETVDVAIDKDDDLGLYIVNFILEKMKGKLETKILPQNGKQFTVTLPVELIEK
ncbi:MAG: PAS domain-containing protein [Bacteroidota bacterium]